MSKDTEHFIEKQDHTQIKHNLLSSVIESSLAIASVYDNRNKEKRHFSYIDLYAGCGEFEDESEGSPLIAYNLISNQLANEKNNISKVSFIATEQSQINSEKLKQSLNKVSNTSIHKDKIEITICDKAWESCKKELEPAIVNSKWGFVFVDPFSTELNLGELKRLISKNIFYKDIMILINLSAHERILGLKEDKSLQKISKYFDSDIRLIKHIKGLYLNEKGFANAQVIQFLIKKAFENLNKDFVINVAIPGTREGKIEESDRFYLTLITGSLGVANQYLTKYAEILGEKEEKKAPGQLDLFSGNDTIRYFELKNKIKEIIEAKINISLYDMVQKLFNNFYSWKKASKNQMPTMTNIRKVLNQLAIDGVIKLNCPSDYYKKNNLEILSQKIQNKINLKHVKIIKL